MFIRIRKFLSSPTVIADKKPLKAGIGYAIAVYAILVVLQPFGIDSAPAEKYIFLLPYGIITYIGFILPSIIIPLLHKDFYNESEWTHGRSIFSYCLVILLIIIGNLSYCIIFFHGQISAHLFWQVVWETVTIGTATLGVKYWLANRELERNLNKVTEINRRLQQTHISPIQTSIVTLEGSGKNASVNIELESLLYVESDKNYCHIVTLNEQKAIRATISSIEEQLSEYNFIIKCHRAYLVNLQNVKEIEGNASNGYKLQMKQTGQIVPVSRSYSSILLERMDEKM